MLKRKITEVSNKCTQLSDRVSKLLGSFEWSDCIFWIGDKKFPAHRLILGISSPVFKAMLYGGLATQEEIIISDIEPDTFQLLLTYIYTDKIDITTLEEAFGLLYAAKKYMLEHLTDKCIEYIEEHTTIDDVLTVLNYADFMQENKLFQSALLLVMEHSDIILVNNADKLSPDSLKALLECNSINIKEIDLIKTVLLWSEFACELKKIPVTVDNRRRILKENGMLKLLRFFTLSSKEFDEIADNVLVPDEQYCIRRIINDYAGRDVNEKTEFIKSKNIDLCQICSPRNDLKVRCYVCHRCPIIQMPPLRIYPASKVNIKIMCSKTIFLNSIVVPSRMSPQVTLKNQGPCYTENFIVYLCRTIKSNQMCRTNDEKMIINFSAAVEYDKNILIHLPQPYLMKKNEWYLITFIWPSEGQQSYKYAVMQRDTVCQLSNAYFHFQDDLNNYYSFLESLKYSF